MATYIPTEDSASGLGHALSSLSTLVNGGHTHLRALVEAQSNLFRGASDGFQNLVSSRTTSGSSSPQEGDDPISPPRTVQTVTDTTQGLTPPTPDDPSTSSAGDIEAPSQTAASGENGLVKAIRTCHKRTGMCMTFILVGFLSLALIVVPGLVLGIVTGQLAWGIALSGTIVSVCGFFAGPVYTIISAGEADESRGEETGEEMV